MEPQPTTRISSHFAALPEPGVARTTRHVLLDMLTGALGAVLCGADAWVEVERCGHAKEDWLRTLLGLANGIPGHATFGRVCARRDPQAFARWRLSWVRRVAGDAAAQVLASDGKTVRRAHAHSAGTAALHLVSAWATASRLVLGQVAVAAQANALAAMPALLRVVDLQGATVTIDALGCQPALARAIRERAADDVLALKDHHPTLAAALADPVSLARAHAVAALAPTQHTFLQTIDTGHGRLELRRCWTISDPASRTYLEPQGAWAAARRIGSTVTVESRYCLRSRGGELRAVAGAARGPWGVDNGWQWIVDIACRAAERRVRVGHGAHHLGVIRHSALTRLRQERTAKCGVKAKRLMAGWEAHYLLKVLTV